MNKAKFEKALSGAVAGRHEDLEVILKLYELMIRKYAYLNGRFDEDLHQHLLIHIALKIGKFIL